MEVCVIAGVLQLRQSAQNVTLIDLITAHKVQHHLKVRIRITQTINSRHGADDNGVAALHECLSRRQTHLLNVLVHRSVFINESIGRRDIGFWLVVVVVRHEVLNGVIREELFEFPVQLRC